MRKLIQRGEDARDWAHDGTLSDMLYRLLRRRGIDSPEAAERFLHPQPEQLHDPMKLSCMGEAVRLIREAREAACPVWVYGDYDVDGVCSTAILTGCLAGLGMDARSYIPSRHKEGYGLNEAAIRQIAEESGCPEKQALLVTVDCGVSCHSEVALARELGLRVIVTDHHRPGEKLPDCPVVNPLLMDYPFPYLCGAGVAFKLCCALVGFDRAKDWLDLAAMATVADIVPLTDENRVIVALGLALINQQPRPGVRALIEAAGLKGRVITAGHIGFQLGPRLNASGRLGDAQRALALLSGKDVASVRPIAAELEQENQNRRQVETGILSQALEQMAGYDLLAHRAIVLVGQGWNSGVIGLAASRLVTRYHYPVILLAAAEGVCTGSCRSIPGVDIFAALSSCADLMIRFGGHRQAAGLTILEEKVPELIARLDDYLAAQVPPGEYIPEAEYDLALPLSLLSPAERAEAERAGLSSLEERLRATLRAAANTELDHAAADEAFERLVGGEEPAPEGELRDPLARVRERLSQTALRLIGHPDTARARAAGVEEAEIRAVRSLELLQPTGFGNPAPVFLCRAHVDSARAVGKDEATLQAALSDGQVSRRAVGFNQGGEAGRVIATDRDILYTPSLNRWRDSVSLQFELREILPEPPEGALERFERKYQLVFNAYLNDLLYNNMLSEYRQTVMPLDREALLRALRESPQGTVIAVTTREGAREAASLFGEDGYDVYTGSWPREAACFNALCLCPAGEAPARCRTLALWDTPREGFAALPRCDRLMECGAAPEWAGALPDVQALRALYVAVRRMAGNGRLGADAPLLLARETGLTELAAQMGIAVLCHMELTQWTRGRGTLALRPPKKTNPGDSPLYQRLRALGGKGRERT